MGHYFIQHLCHTLIIYRFILVRNIPTEDELHSLIFTEVVHTCKASHQYTTPAVVKLILLLISIKLLSLFVMNLSLTYQESFLV